MKAFKPRLIAAAIVASVLGGMVAAPAADARDDDRDRNHRFATRLSGFNEVHFSAGPPATLRGAVSTKASGSFRAALDAATQTIAYELTYQDLEGAVTQSHIHFGQRHTTGGITIWLCQTAANPAPAAVAASTPQCPVSGTVTGSITPGQVLAVTGQGIDAGQFDEVVRAMRAGAMYVNVHSSLFPPGEIRGQIRRGGD